jgi:hypothetical protein
MLDGALQGPHAIRAVIGGLRELYDRQDFNFAGPWRDGSFIEDYTAEDRASRRGLGAPRPARTRAQPVFAAHDRCGHQGSCGRD